MNLKQRKFVLSKRLKGEQYAYYRVRAISCESYVLKDIVQGDEFYISSSQLYAHIDNGVLEETEVPQTELICAATKRREDRSAIGKLIDEYEINRRYEYVAGALNLEAVEYTKIVLEQLISETSKKINDVHPPRCKVLRSWINTFLQSGSEKESLLLDRYLALKTLEVLDSVIVEICVSEMPVSYGEAHRKFVSKIDDVNRLRMNIGLELLEASDFRTTVNRLRLTTLDLQFTTMLLGLTSLRNVDN
ncbi:MAG: hypothetical protein ACTH4J_10995 [Vibrio toranzoniae]|uniref:hypothetical protein n=1 Tax=Vibrio toranzoniae TaxID=1194427 RepID=UPI003F9C45D0